MEKELIEERAKALKREYHKKWYRNHPGKAKEYMQRYWERKAEKLATMEESYEKT